MNPTDFERVLQRLQKLEGVVAKLAEWTHYGQPLGFESTEPLSSPLPQKVGLSSSPKKSIPSTSHKNSAIPPSRRPYRKRSPATITTSSNKVPSKRTKYYDEGSSDQEEVNSDLDDICGIQESGQVVVKVEIEDEVDSLFAVLPDSEFPPPLPQDNHDNHDNHDNDFSFEFVDGESTTTTNDQTRDEVMNINEEETPGLLVFPTASRNYVAYRGFLYIYQYKNETTNKQVFRCHHTNQTPRGICRGRIHLSFNLKTVILGQDSENSHSHPAEQDYIDAKYFMWRITSLASTNRDKSVAEIVAEEIPKLSESCRKHLPKLSSIHRRIQRHISSGRRSNAAAATDDG